MSTRLSQVLYLSLVLLSLKIIKSLILFVFQYLHGLCMHPPHRYPIAHIPLDRVLIGRLCAWVYVFRLCRLMDAIHGDKNSRYVILPTECALIIVGFWIA